MSELKEVGRVADRSTLLDKAKSQLTKERTKLNKIQESLEYEQDRITKKEEAMGTRERLLDDRLLEVAARENRVGMAERELERMKSLLDHETVRKMEVKDEALNVRMKVCQEREKRFDWTVRELETELRVRRAKDGTVPERLEAVKTGIRTVRERFNEAMLAKEKEVNDLHAKLKQREKNLKRAEDKARKDAAWLEAEHQQQLHNLWDQKSQLESRLSEARKERDYYRDTEVDIFGRRYYR